MWVPSCVVAMIIIFVFRGLVSIIAVIVTIAIPKAIAQSIKASRPHHVYCIAQVTERTTHPQLLLLL